MLRTTIYLTEEVALILRQLSEIHQRSQAELIRDAIDAYIATCDLSTYRQALPGMGAYRSGRADVSERAEDLLRQKARKKR